MKRLLLIFVGIITAYTATASVVLQYHHVSDTTPKSTSVTPEQFKQHLDYLANDSTISVVPLSVLLENNTNSKTNNGDQRDNKIQVAITFDDGYTNIFENARPLLKEYGFPYAIFVNPGAIDSGKAYAMTWDQLRLLGEEGVEFGNHTTNHSHLTTAYGYQEKSKRLQIIQQDIELAESRLTKELGQNHHWLAYPYGEFSLEIQQLVRAMNFIGFGQHSGPIGSSSNYTRLPRFPVSGFYANIDKLPLKVTSLPFSIKRLQNADPVTLSRQPKLIVTLNTHDIMPDQLMCYVPNQGGVKPTWSSEDTFEISAPAPLAFGRSRYNCTAPSKQFTGRYYWFSQPWLIIEPH